MSSPVQLETATPSGRFNRPPEGRTIQLGLEITAAIRGDPVTKAIAHELTGASVTRTALDSWRIVDTAGRVFTARVSGTTVAVRGQDGNTTRVSIQVPRTRLPSLPSLKLPHLPGIDLGAVVTGVVSATIGAAIRQPAIGTVALAAAVQLQHPLARVRSDGPNTWTVSNLGLEAPFQVRIHADTISAERNGRPIASKSLATGDVSAALRSLFRS